MYAKAKLIRRPGGESRASTGGWVLEQAEGALSGSHVDKFVEVMEACTIRQGHRDREICLMEGKKKKKAEKSKVEVESAALVLFRLDCIM